MLGSGRNLGGKDRRDSVSSYRGFGGSGITSNGHTSYHFAILGDVSSTMRLCVSARPMRGFCYDLLSRTISTNDVDAPSTLQLDRCPKTSSRLTRKISTPNGVLHRRGISLPILDAACWLRCRGTLHTYYLTPGVAGATFQQKLPGQFCTSTSTKPRGIIGSLCHSTATWFSYCKDHFVLYGP